MKYLIWYITICIFLLVFIQSTLADESCCSGSDYNCFTMELIKSRKSKDFNRELLQEDYRIPMQKSAVSPKGYFVIHYDTSGTDMVDLYDFNNNGIPDYVDSVAFYFDLAYEFLVNKLGYNPPPSDSGFGGDDKYDIYLINLVSDSYAIYGYTEVELDINPPSKNPRYTSSIRIDNNFSPYDSIIASNGNMIPAYAITEIDAVRITSVHELHHAIQFGYGYPDDGVAFMEMSSTWLESALHPDANNYLNYINDLFKNIEAYPLSDSQNPQVGYRWNIFFKFLADKYSDSIVRNFWDNIAEDQAAFESLYYAITNNGLDYHNTWKEFLTWIYHTNTRSNSDLYFKDASRFPRLTISTEEIMRTSNIEFTENLLPYQIFALKIINATNDQRGIRSIDVISSYIPKITFESEQPISASLNISANRNLSEAINYSNFSYRLTPHTDFATVAFVNDGARYPDDSFVLPNPVDMNVDNFFIAVPMLERLNQKYNVMIFDPSYNMMLNTNIEPTRFEGFNGFKIDIKNNKMSSGVYFYNINGDDKNYFGKFALIMKN